MDEYAQTDVEYDELERPKGSRHAGKGGGNRAEQQRRYRARYPVKYRDYMRAYMRARRARCDAA